MIMSEYLSTTTLGDLQRKSNDINISEQLEEKRAADQLAENARIHQATSETPATASTTEAERPSPFSSMIRSSIGEVNQ